MSGDYREEAVDYYDKFSGPPPGDVDFYRQFVKQTTRVLELGCGTGRVMVPLAAPARYVHGMDHSPAMLARCQEKLEAANISASRAQAEVGDITDFDLLGRMPAFDLIIAPFRVMQNLESDQQVDGLMRCIKKHLTADGLAILNTFCPMSDPATMKARWDTRDAREPAWTQPDGDGTVTLTENCSRYREHPFTMLPELTYRRYDAQGIQIGESVLKFAMRIWYPDELIHLIESHGFAVTRRFGGYEGQPWGEGTELVVAFRHEDRSQPGDHA
ncbi:MAG TPA: class I SAM-dependent methyltransferase [Candidatus Saccharimonadia bacterium]|nr:class I SAM-dependent methyltransferase [Candidatus Saccharimonadia bacterium]